MNTQDDLKEKKKALIKKHLAAYYRHKGKEIGMDDILPMSRILPMMEEYAKAYAPVPGKEDAVVIWGEPLRDSDNRCLKEKAVEEYYGLNPKDTNETFAINTDFGHLVNLLYMWEQKNAASTKQSNEDKERGQPFLDMGKCISALHLELPSKVWEDVSSKWMAVMSAVTKMLPHPENEPKAVQQAAKSIEKIAEEKYPYANGTDSAALAWNNRTDVARRAFLAGASFNSKVDGKEDQYWSQAISMIEVADTDGNDYLQKYDELHKKLKSKFTITSNKNEIQQAHDKSTYE